MRLNILYLNDRKITAKVGVDNLSNLKEVKPTGTLEIEIDIKDNEKLFLKQWEDGLVLISKTSK